MTEISPAELLAALQRAQEGEHAAFRAAVEPDIVDLERQLASLAPPARGRRRRAPAPRRPPRNSEKRVDPLEMLAMVAKVVSEIDHPAAAGPSIAAPAPAPAVENVTPIVADQNQGGPAAVEAVVVGGEQNTAEQAPVAPQP